MSSPTSLDDSKSTPPSPSSTFSILPLYKPSPYYQGSRSRLTSILSETITPANTTYLLIICCFITGLLDSTLFHAYGTFVSGQTGNTILFGLGASTAHSTTRPYRWAKSLIAIVCYVFGCISFSYVTRRLGKLIRGTLVLSFVFQGALVLLVGGFVEGEVVEGKLHKLNEEINWKQALPIALLAFQTAGQIVASRQVGVNKIPTVVLTSMLYDFASDPGLLRKDNKERNGMVGAFIGTLLGAVAGGFLSVGTGQMQSSLWLVGGLKFVIAGAFMLWPADEGQSSG